MTLSIEPSNRPGAGRARTTPAPAGADFPSRRRRFLRRVAVAAASCVLTVGAGTAVAAPAEALTLHSRCMNFDPGGTPPQITVGAGPVSVGAGDWTAPMKICVRLTTSARGVAYSYGYQLAPSTWAYAAYFPTRTAEVCNVWLDVDVWSRDGRLDMHSQGNLVTGFPGDRPTCYGNDQNFTATRTEHMPLVVDPGAVVCVNMYRHAYRGAEPPVLVVRGCTTPAL